MIDSADLRSLRTELDEAGVFEHHEAAGWLRLVLLLALLSACIGAAATLPLWTALVWVPLASLTVTTTAMLGHEGCHGSFSSSPWRNQLFASLTFPLLSGLGVQYWKHKHNVLHHGHPNVSGTDPDIDIWPMAISKEVYEESGPLRRWLQRHFQAWAFWPLTLALPIVMRTPSITHLARAPKRRRNAAWWLDVSCLITHYVLWLGVGSMVFGVVPALLAYVAIWSLAGLFLALIFAPAHMGLPVVEGQNKGWLHQIETTRNLRVPRGVRWFFVGLDYQIEHHLFPRIPHQHLTRARDITRAWCERHQIPHRSVGYGEALKDIHGYLRNAWKTPATTPASLRATWQQRPASPAG